METPSAPRIAPLSIDEFRAVFSDLFGRPVPANEPVRNITLTWARHPALLKAQRPYQLHLRSGSVLPRREQELAILRIGWRCNCEYEFGEHTLFGLSAGLSEEEVRRVIDGPQAPGWSERETILLRVVDEVYETQRLSDETWAALSDHLGAQQILELLSVIGRYWTVCAVLNSVRIAREAGAPGFPVPRNP